MADRSRIVLIRGSQVALIQRRREGILYYVFPGGGIEPGETPEDAALREAEEELGVRVRLGRLVAIDHFDGVRSYFFLADLVDGEFGTGRNLPNPGRGDYLPVWVELGELSGLPVRPNDISQALASGLLSESVGFPLITGVPVD